MPRSIWSYSRVQKCVGWLLRNRTIQVACTPSLLYLNIGCGRNVQPGFINVDSNWHPQIHLCWDIRYTLPFANASAEGIFTEHCLEHVTYDQCLESLRDMYRILRCGAVLRVIVPDGGLYLDLYHRYQSGEKVEFPYVDDVGQVDLQLDSRYGFTPMMAVNRIFRGYGHLFAYDHDTMKNLLLKAGFKSVEKCTFRRGRVKELLIDSELRAPQSMFVEAIK